MKTVKKTVKAVPGIMWASLIIIILFILFVPNFAQIRNFTNIMKNASILLIISIGMTMAILSGQIDLSIGGVMSSSAMIGAIYLSAHEIITPGVLVMTLLIGTLVGIAFGIFNGIMIGKFKYNYWLVTFATMSMGYGLAQVVTNGNIIAGFEKSFRKIADGTILGLPSVVVITAVIIIGAIVIINKTKFGMYTYAIGDSEQCALQSGINTVKIRCFIYTCSGLLAGLGGILLASKTNSASATIGTGYEFDAIAAVVIGGTSFEGGKGSVGGTIVGALVIQSVKSALQLMGFSSYWQQTLIGLFILSVIVFDVVNEYKKKIQKTRRIYKDAKC